jgi:hypothetical protein
MTDLPPPYVVLVTGSRFWDDVWAVKDALDQAVADAKTAGAREFILRHGACFPPADKHTGIRPHRSADYLAHLWFMKYAKLMPLPQMTVQARPADWEGPCRPACNQATHRGRNVNHRRVRGCPMAGIHRNKDMVLEDPRPDYGIAFQRDNSSGTGNCIKTMREFSIPVREIPYQPQGEKS